MNPTPISASTKTAPNAALRELAGRLEKLTYNDMIRFSEALKECGATISPMTILQAAQSLADA